MNSEDTERLENELETLRQQVNSFQGSSTEVGALMAVNKGITLRLAEILAILVKRAPAVVSRDSLSLLFYGDREDGGPDPKIFNVHISRLRAILKRAECPGKIVTIWQAGFKADPSLVAWVQEVYKTHNV